MVNTAPSKDLEETIDFLQRELEKSIESFGSAYELLQCNDQLMNNATDLNLQGIKKKFILDSFKVSKIHKDYREWEHEQKERFIGNDIKEYNRMTGKMFRVNDSLEKSTEKFEKLSSSVRLPEFELSIKTLQLYGDESLLESCKDKNGEYPRSVKLNQLFSLEKASSLPFPDYKIINQLINLEYRLRIERRLKYEVLKLIKNQILVENSRWTTRNNYLEGFFNKRLPEAIEEVEKIKNESMKEHELSSASSEDEREEDLDENLHEEDEEEEEEDDEIEIEQTKEEHRDEDESDFDHGINNGNSPTSSSSRDQPTSRPEPTKSDAESEDDEMLLDN